MSYGKFRFRHNKGQIAPFFTFLIIILLILAIFTVNLGRIGFHRVRTSIAADTGALAGGTYMDYALNNLSAKSKEIFMSYVVGMVTCAIPIWVECDNTYCNIPIPWTCTHPKCVLPPCAVAIPRAILEKEIEMWAFIVNQYAQIYIGPTSAKGLAVKGFRTARGKARGMAFQNAGVDDLTRFDRYASGAPNFTKDNPDAVLSSAYDGYFIYRDAWLAKGEPDYTSDTWQKAESRFGLWLGLWEEKEESGGANKFNRFGSMSYEWSYPIKEEKNKITVNTRGDDFSGLVTVPSPVYGLVMGIGYECTPIIIWIPFGPPHCVACVPLPTPFYIHLVEFGPVMFVIGIDDFGSGSAVIGRGDADPKTPIITVNVKRTEPISKSLVFWQSKYPEVESEATAEVSGGSIGTEGDDNYDTVLISTK